MLQGLRFRMAALVAFLIGVPFTAKAVAQVGEIITGGVALAGAIVDSAGES